jgi:hypothetical protein
MKIRDHIEYITSSLKIVNYKGQKAFEGIKRDGGRVRLKKIFSTMFCEGYDSHEPAIEVFRDGQVFSKANIDFHRGCDDHFNGLKEVFGKAIEQYTLTPNHFKLDDELKLYIPLPEKEKNALYWDGKTKSYCDTPSYADAMSGFKDYVLD